MFCHINWPKVPNFGGNVVLSSSEISNPKTLNAALDTEDQGTIILRNACNCLPVDTAKYRLRFRYKLDEAERRNWLMIMS